MDQRKILTAAKAAVQAALDVTDAAITTSELFIGITSLVATSARSSKEREEVVTSLILCALGLVGSDATNNILQAILFKREALSYLNAKIQITLAVLQDTGWGYTWADTHRRQGKVAAAVELKRRILALNVPLTKGRCFRLCECALNRYYKERNARGGAHKDRDRAQKETGYFDALRASQRYLEAYG